MKPLALYVHIPFCQVKCPYCDFYSLADTDHRIDQYAAKLQEEIAFFAPRVGTQYQVTSLFFGGGTPSYVPAQVIEQTLGNLKRQFSFLPETEITLEMNPGSCETAKLADYRTMGIRRISMGIQSFQDHELRFLGRAHNAQEAHDAIAAVRQAGYENFNLDFIFAVPGQSPETWMNTLETALAYEPPHISAYNLTYEEGTPLAGQKLSGTVRPLLDATELAMYKKAIRRLQRAGLMQYEISNFARPGKEARHNLAYWTGQDYLGFGVGAHSYFEGKRFSKKRSLPHYLATTSPQGMDLLQDEDLSPRRRFWEIVAIGLRNLKGVSTEKTAEQWGIAVDQDVRNRWEPWIRQGFLQMKNGLLSLRPKGLYFYDQIASAMIDFPETPAATARRTTPIPR